MIQPMTWFGAPWDSWVNEECERQATPTGEPCLRCEESIESWASGVVQSCVTTEGASRRPLHLECFLRETFGSVGHLCGWCSCFGGDEEDPEGMTRREAARASVLVSLEIETYRRRILGNAAVMEYLARLPLRISDEERAALLAARDFQQATERLVRAGGEAPVDMEEIHAGLLAMAPEEYGIGAGPGEIVVPVTLRVKHEMQVQFGVEPEEESDA